MQQPLVVEVWGKQSDSDDAKNNNNDSKREKMSTKQLMNANSVSKANVINKSARDDDEKYKTLSELSSLRKRNQRLNSRMVCC